LRAPIPPKDADRRRVYLMRHGSVTYFDETGRPVDPDSVALNERGRAQATAAGQALARSGIRFDRVIVSGLPRTVQTAERVLAESAHAPELEHWNDLVELQGGRLSDIPDDGLREAFLGAFDGVVEAGARFLGGESIAELLDRVLPCVDRLRADDGWDVALLVLHGGVNRAILSYLLTSQRLFLGNLAQAPGCINAIDVGEERGDAVLRLVNYSPTDETQTETRKTTMEALLEQYLKFRGMTIQTIGDR
jgi:broad specificity phosphatase PhoE